MTDKTARQQTIHRLDHAKAEPTATIFIHMIYQVPSIAAPTKKRKKQSHPA
jgi:hypothetical protein